MAFDLEVTGGEVVVGLVEQLKEQADMDEMAIAMAQTGAKLTEAFQEGGNKNTLRADTTRTISLGLQAARVALRKGHEDEFERASTTQRDRR